MGTFKGQLDVLLAQPRIRGELLEAARVAEADFRAEACRQLSGYFQKTSQMN